MTAPCTVSDYRINDDCNAEIAEGAEIRTDLFKKDLCVLRVLCVPSCPSRPSRLFCPTCPTGPVCEELAARTNRALGLPERGAAVVAERVQRADVGERDELVAAQPRARREIVERFEATLG